MSNLPDINFSAIRTLNNSKNKAFEELAVQLFRKSIQDATEFYRVDDGGGDGGVEDVAYLREGGRIGLQAKFVQKVSKSLWSQIDKSVRTAIDSHKPDLLEYQIFVPCNRRKDSQSWRNYQQKWNDYGKSLGYSKPINFRWIGDSEIRDKLIQEEFRPFLHYWFGARLFSYEWLSQKFDSCRQIIDTRYTPNYHVRTDSERKIDAFFLRRNFHSKFRNCIKGLLDACRKDFEFKETEELCAKAMRHCKEISVLFRDEEKLPNLEDLINCLDSLYDALYSIQEAYINLDQRDENPAAYNRNYSYPLQRIANLLSITYQAKQFLEDYAVYASTNLLVLGEAGAGKSHLLAKAIDKGIRDRQVCLLLTGEQFTDARAVHVQVCEILGWEDGYESLFGALESEAIISGKPAVLAIDALNEAANRRLWKSHLLSLTGILRDYPHIRLLVSCRSDFNEITLPEQLLKNSSSDWKYINHSGFGVEIFTAVRTYFSGYGVRCVHFPPILEEFKNPLFLKLLCEVYSNQTIPPGSLAFVQVLEKRISHLATAIQRSIDCSEAKTRKALNQIAKRISANAGLPVPCDEIQEITEAVFSESKESRSLYRHLRSNGIIVETIHFQSGTGGREGVVCVRFSFERFSDYLICSEILDRFKCLAELKDEWKENDFFRKWTEDWHTFHTNRGLLRMLAVLVPEHFSCEFIDLHDWKPAYISELYGDFLRSLPWRTLGSVSNRTEILLSECAKHLSSEEYLNLRLKLVTIPGHPLNAESIHKRLFPMRLPDRELVWTIPVCNLTSWSEPNTVDEIVRWSFHVPEDFVSDEQTWLVALFLSWLLTSNFRLLRKRASLALIKILSKRVHLAAKLVRQFHDCNDPYVAERIYAVACGVALRIDGGKGLAGLAHTVYEKMFRGAITPANILQREYAQLIVEKAAHLGVLADEIELSDCRPVYRSEWPRIISENKATELEKRDGWARIAGSLRPEHGGIGLYGDFGRYVMDSMVHRFSNQKIDNPYKRKKPFSDVFSGMVARRYILKRIDELGWTATRFKEYESRLSVGRFSADQEENKVERISKKYQWIGLHELLGLLSDHFWMLPGYDEDAPEPFLGPWQMWARDFDPSHPLVDPDEHSDLSDDDTNEIESDRWILFPDQFSDLKLRSNREAWVNARPDDFSALISIEGTPSMAGSWVNLSGHFSWFEPLTVTQSEEIEGQLKMWVDVRCWLLSRSDRERFLRAIRGHRFYGNGCDIPDFSDRWIGEFPWAPSLQSIQRQFEGDRWLGWDRKPLIIQSFCGFRDSRPKVFPRLPSPIVHGLLKLRWSGEGYSYRDDKGEITAFCAHDPDPFVGTNGILLVDREKFLNATQAAGLIPVWAILSERSCYSHSKGASIVKKWAITQQVYEATETGFAQCHKLEYDIPLYG